MTIALPDTIALVTGATGGIGRALCKALKAAGATVVATDLGADANGAECDLYLQQDVTSEAGWKAAEAEIRSRWGRLDGLVHNAGVSVVAMAAGLLKLGAAMDEKLAERNAPMAAGTAVPVAQPTNKLLVASAPKGSMGAADRNLSAARRVCNGVGVMSVLSRMV